MRTSRFALAVFAAVAFTASFQAAAADDDWLSVGNSLGGTRYSRLTQITPGNVSGLKLVWSYKIEAEPDPVKHPYVAFEGTPLKIDDTLYFCQPNNTLVALDAETGQPRWKAPSNLRPWGGFRACRGIAYYRVPEGRAPAGTTDCSERLVTATVDARLRAVDIKTGKPCQGFGDNGVVDLSKGLGPLTTPGVYSATSAPTIVRNVIVIGGSVNDNGHMDNPSGVIRAYDVMTGKLAWAWDMERPDSHGEPAGDEYYTRNTPNGWAPFSADEELGLVYVPTGNSNPDYYGAKRTPAAEKYSSAVIALDATNGTVRWSFQTTHHDLWDYDVASQPVLVDLKLPQGVTPALIQATKRGETFLLDRRDGHPLAPVEEKPVPQGAGAGDWTAKTQPFSALPSQAGPPLTEQDMWGVTPLDSLWCRIQYRKARYDGPMTPPTPDRPWIYSPGWMGGNDWGSVSVDEEHGVMVAVSMRMANYDRFIKTSADAAAGKKPTFGITRQFGSPYYGVDTDYFHSPLGVPCQRPPYGMITAIDLVSHKLLWSRPFGTARDSGPLSMSVRIPLPIPMGAVTMGGNLITKSGLVFLGAALDQYLRALDVQTGNELWKTHLSAAAFATPMTYVSHASGRQFVIATIGGNSHFGPNEGLYVQAYALPGAR